MNLVSTYEDGFFKQTVSLHSLDEPQENYNKDTKQLMLGATKKSWAMHSPNVIFAQCSIAYKLEEYKTAIVINNNDNSHEININKSGVAQRKNLEHVRLYEFLVKLIGENCTSRKYQVKVRNDIIKILETKLNKNEYTKKIKILIHLNSV